MSYIKDASRKVLMTVNSVIDAFFVSGDTVNRYTQDASGKQEWGSGSAVVDNTLERAGAGVMKFSQGGIAETVTAYTTTGTLTTNGTAALGATAATTYSLPDPVVAGQIKRIVSTTTQTQTIVMATTNGVKFNSTGVSITFAADACAITLQALSTTRWAVLGTNTTSVTLA